MRYLLIILCILFSPQLLAAEGPPPAEEVVLARAPVNPADMESIKRGAKFFATTCMSCHTLIYLRYNKVAQDAGITLDKMPINVKTWPNGVTPPDLSLEVDVRGVDWIYTYLHSFYTDTTRPTGANNLLVNNTAMPNIVGPYQGEQMLATTSPYSHGIYGDHEWFNYLTLVKSGTMTTEQFDGTITDVVNFLAYAAAPYQEEQHRIGMYVLLFLAIFFVMAYMLKREYWKDVKKHRKE